MCYRISVKVGVLVFLLGEGGRKEVVGGVGRVERGGVGSRTWFFVIVVGRLLCWVL